MNTILELQTLTLTGNTEEVSLVLMSTASGICGVTTMGGDTTFQME
jgi:hypothetical protein